MYFRFCEIPPKISFFWHFTHYCSNWFLSEFFFIKYLCPTRLPFYLINAQHLQYSPDWASQVKDFRCFDKWSLFFNNLFTVHSRISLPPRRSACEQKAEVVFKGKWTFIFHSKKLLGRKISTLRSVTHIFKIVYRLAASGVDPTLRNKMQR